MDKNPYINKKYTNLFTAALFAALPKRGETGLTYQISLETSDNELVRYFDSIIDHFRRVSSIPDDYREEFGNALQYFVTSEEYRRLQKKYPMAPAEQTKQFSQVAAI